MSKRTYIARYMLIVKKVSQKPYSSYEDLKDYIEQQAVFMQVADDDHNIAFSKRTFVRDLNEIRSTFGIDIEYSIPRRGYVINTENGGNRNFERILEAFDLFNSFNLAQDLSQYIHFEKRKPLGTEHLHPLLHAIKNKLEIAFNYQSFDNLQPGGRSAVPYALKEFKNRWYLLALNNKHNNIKCYALDRLTNLVITNKTFQFPPNFNVDEYYRYCYGIICPDNQEVEEIILSFTPQQGKYAKTLPLHPTQQIVLDNEDELQIKLTLYVTFDFIMELLSYGDAVKVKQPKSLAKHIKNAHKDAYLQY